MLNVLSDSGKKFKVVGVASEIQLENLLPIIRATAVLHNISKDYNDIIDIDDDADDDSDEHLDDMPTISHTKFKSIENTNVRDLLANSYYFI